MKRTQIIIIILAVLSIAGLYSLPRVVVDNDDNDAQGMVTAPVPDGNMVDHSSEIPEDVLPVVQKWKAAIAENGQMRNDASALDSLMEVFKSINKYDSAAYYAGQFAEAFPDVQNWRKAGDAYYEAFNFAVDAAKSQLLSNNANLYYQRILDAGDNDLDVRSNIAMMLVDTSNPMQGVMMLREILTEAPDHKAALYNMGVLSIRSQQFERGVERFETLVGYYPDHLEGNYYLGVCYFETGEMEKAKTQFEKIKEMDSDEMVQATADDYLERIK